MKREEKNYSRLNSRKIGELTVMNRKIQKRVEREKERKKEKDKRWVNAHVSEETGFEFDYFVSFLNNKILFKNLTLEYYLFDSICSS